MHVEFQGKELLVEQYWAVADFDLIPSGVKCSECDVKLSGPEGPNCMRIAHEKSGSELWYCEDHIPFEVVREQ